MAGNTFDLKGGVAVITGAASGIGAALAENLSRRGMNLALADRDGAGLDAVAARLKQPGVHVTTHVLDVTDRAALAALPAQVVAAHGRVTVLVNNAGVGVGGTFLQVDEADFDWLMEINFHAVVRLTRAFLPILAREKAAQVVNISSVLGIVASPGQTAYCASKFAVRGFSESLRHELEMEASPVGVTIVHPGGVRTAIADNAKAPPGATQAQLEEARRRWERILVMQPSEAAEIIAKGIEQRSPRVIVGRDARAATLLQRLFPVTYWKHMAKGIERQAARG